jgi:hypothetical protein
VRAGLVPGAGKPGEELVVFHFTSSGRGPESARQNLAVSGSDDKAILIWGFG